MKITNNIKLSKQLVWRLKNLTEGISIKTWREHTTTYDSNGVLINIPCSKTHIVVEIVLQDNSDDILNCMKWLEINNKYFSTSYKKLSIDVGSFVGLRPLKIGPENNKVTFIVSEINYKPTWRDWFIIEEED